MRLNTNPRPVRWTDRTLSVLRISRLEACEKELAGLGGCGLFDAETTDADAERLFEQSYYAEEEKKDIHLHTIEELREKVISAFPAEVTMLCEEEFNLLMKLAFLGGEIPLWDWNDLLPARSLIRRMWCRAVPEKGNWIRLPRQLCVMAILSLANDELHRIREITDEIIETVDNTLYLAGMMPAETVEKDIGFRLQGSLAGEHPMLWRRLIHSAFETMLDREGRLMLVHPGLAEPRSLAQAQTGVHAGLEPSALTELYASLMEVEDPLYDQMMGLISSLSRPEASPEDTVEDLILLAKQGAPVEEMRQVLGTKIICLPTAEMIDVLRVMHDRIPKWFTLNMERVQ